ncbi:MAG: hypothetical protein QG588_576, partial [Candidatus Poribacteria bacterium]|nr:hypothetical protein [Candidatus Poribacteria bacterium]
MKKQRDIISEDFVVDSVINIYLKTGPYLYKG